MSQTEYYSNSKESELHPKQKSNLDFFEEAYKKLCNEFSSTSSYNINENIQKIQDLEELEMKILNKLDRNIKIKFKNLQLSEYFDKSVLKDELPF